jgi:AcrR family transcriptional regulator
VEVERLPRGRHGLSREFVARNQRERVLAALAECLYERGFAETTISMISRRAGVSKGDFYKQFESKDACFLEAYGDAAAQFYEGAVAACEGADGWADGVVAALAALLDLLARRPAQARLVLVEGLRVGKGVYDRYQDALLAFVPHLAAGAPAPPGAAGLPPATDEAVVGGIASLLSRRIAAGEIEQLPDFLPEVAEFALAPYLGAAEARRIISTKQ